jgi:hypothetical protein
MYTLAHDENDKNVRYWWVNFWINVGMKLPQIAADRIQKLLIITIDRKDVTCLSLLTVNISRSINIYIENKPIIDIFKFQNFDISIPL